MDFEPHVLFGVDIAFERAVRRQPATPRGKTADRGIKRLHAGPRFTDQPGQMPVA